MRTRQATKPKPGGLTPASGIINAGGADRWARKTNYNSQTINLSGIIDLTDQQVEEAMAASRR